MAIQAHILQRAMELYLGIAYPGAGAPAAVKGRVEAIRNLNASAEVPDGLLETDAANAVPGFALRLGQPLYPHMKIMIEAAPGEAGAGWLVRVDSHDRHLHAPENSPDAAWLASIRASNKDLGERIEAAWSAAGLPTFKDFLRRQLEARKRGR